MALKITFTTNDPAEVASLILGVVQKQSLFCDQVLEHKMLMELTPTENLPCHRPLGGSPIVWLTQLQSGILYWRHYNTYRFQGNKPNGSFLFLTVMKKS